MDTPVLVRKRAGLAMGIAAVALLRTGSVPP